MKVSVDISLYPIKNDYREPILDFIQDLKNSEFTVIENSLKMCFLMITFMFLY
jgi:hypothetical protein